MSNWFIRRWRRKLAVRTPEVSRWCTYPGTDLSACSFTSVGELRANMETTGVPWGLCIEHMKPEYHAKGVRSQLVRWPALSNLYSDTL